MNRWANGSGVISAVDACLAELDKRKAAGKPRMKVRLRGD